MPLTPATRLGPYEIVGPLGAGGMGEVYLAHDPRLKRDIAIKVLPAEMMSSPDRLARFEREATTVARLNHPNIVVLYSIEEDGGTRFLTMELIEGQSLDQALQAGALPVPRVIELGIALAEALAAAHEKGVIHRDLKPANVMLTKDGRVKVLDFGLAKLSSPESDPTHSLAATIAVPISSAGLIVGTAAYMAPEQVRGESVDARTDLFSLGVLMFELASGRRPFTGPTFADVSSAILRDSQPSLTNFRSDVPADLERIIGRCLEKQPRARLQSALDVVNELRALKGALDRGEAPTVRSAPDPVASIAVLPFANRSASADDEYFCDGLADELLSLLAKIPGLRVAARTSAFYFKDKSASIAQIGKALNVATVLEGSVRKAGQRVRVSIQLVNVSDGYQLWSETYDRTLDDVFAVQDDVARAVVTALPGTLALRPSGSTPRPGTSDHDAHDAFLEGRFYWNKRTDADGRKAIGFFERAIAIDPGFAEAWAGLADCYVTQSFYSLIPTSDALPKAKEAAHRALKLRPELGAAYATLAYVSMIDFKWAEAESAYRRAVELSPDDATARVWYADLLMMTARMNAALREARRALELDPLSSRVWTGLGQWHWCEGQFDNAMNDFRKALELTPTMPLALELAARVCWQRDDVDEYFGLRERLEAVSERVAVSTHELRKAHSRGGRSEVLRAQLSAPVARQLPTDRARWHAELGDLDAAFRDLEDAVAQREIRLPYVTYYADFAPLRSDPRYGELLARLGVE
jgi:eukaryotic-like serine/threonine-protein kinase